MDGWGGIDPALKTDKQAGRRGNKTEKEKKARGSVRQQQKGKSGGQNLAKTQRMDQSQGESKAVRLWKHRRETAIVCSYIRPCFLLTFRERFVGSSILVVSLIQSHSLHFFWLLKGAIQ